MSSFLSLFKSKPEQNKSAAAPKSNSAQRNTPGQTPASTSSSAKQLQQSYGNQAVGKRIMQQQAESNTTKDAAETPSSDEYRVDGGMIDTVYTNKLYEPLKNAVLMKLGVGRGAWRRSKELNKVRQAMKDISRDESNKGIDNKFENDEAHEDRGNLEKSFFGMIAKKEAYSLSKGSVDKAMGSKAEEIVNTVLPVEITKQQLKLAAHSSAFEISKEKQSIKKKMDAAALTGAQKKAIELLKKTQTLAVNEARKITKGDKEKPNSGPDMAQLVGLATQIRDNVNKDDIAGKAITKAVSADTLGSGLSKIGKLIDLAVPNAGDSAAFNFELKIPVGQSGAYVLFGLGAEAEKEEDELSVNAQVTFGAGFEIFILDANYQAGLYLECQSENSTSVMNLISYGMYRNMRIIMPKAADYFWGQDGKSGMEQVEEAELWAAMVEQRYMSKDSYVDVGLLTQFQAELDLGAVELGIATSSKMLNRYDKDTVEALDEFGFGDATNVKKLKEKAQRLKHASSRVVIGAESEVAAKFGNQEVSFALEGTGSIINNKFRELEISAGCSIPFQYGEDGAEWAKKIAKFAGPVAGASKNIIKALQNKANNGDELTIDDLGTRLDAASDLMTINPAFDELGTSLAEQIQVEEEVDGVLEVENKIGLKSQLDLSFNITKEWDEEGKASDWEVALEAAQTKSFEIDAGLVTFAVEKSKRLAKIGIKKKDGKRGLVGGALGFEKDIE